MPGCPDRRRSCGSVRGPGRELAFRRVGGPHGNLYQQCVLRAAGARGRRLGHVADGSDHRSRRGCARQAQWLGRRDVESLRQGVRGKQHRSQREPCRQRRGDREVLLCRRHGQHLDAVPVALRAAAEQHRQCHRQPLHLADLFDQSLYQRGVRRDQHQLSGAQRQHLDPVESVRQLDQPDSEYVCEQSDRVAHFVELSDGLARRVQPLRLRQRRYGRRQPGQQRPLHAPDRPRHPVASDQSATAGVGTNRLRGQPVPGHEFPRDGLWRRLPMEPVGPHPVRGFLGGAVFWIVLRVSVQSPAAELGDQCQRDARSQQLSAGGAGHSGRHDRRPVPRCGLCHPHSGPCRARHRDRAVPGPNGSAADADRAGEHLRHPDHAARRAEHLVRPARRSQRHHVHLLQRQERGDLGDGRRTCRRRCSSARTIRRPERVSVTAINSPG